MLSRRARRQRVVLHHVFVVGVVILMLLVFSTRALGALYTSSRQIIHETVGACNPCVQTFRGMAKQAALYSPRLVTYSGDISYSDGTIGDWELFMENAAPVLGAMPVLVQEGVCGLGVGWWWVWMNGHSSAQR